MLRYLKDRYKTAIYLVDHLSDLSHAELDELIHLVKGLYVSMDGSSKDTYEKIKQGCSFDKVVDNIRYIIERKRALKLHKPELHFRYVIIKDNVKEIPGFIDLINSLGSKKDFELTTINFTGLLYFDSIKQFYVSTLNEGLIAEIKKRMNKGVYFRFEHTIEKFNPSLEKCYYWMEPYLMMEGYVLPCCQVLMSNQRPFLRQHSFGNVFKNSFKDIWNSKKYNNFRKTIVNPQGKVPIFCVGCRQFKTEERLRKYGVEHGN
jgi:MoaA/NifB/PqqE/SkfB family radical SAM enzyme